jgi:hypothetical protein
MPTNRKPLILLVISEFKIVNFSKTYDFLYHPLHSGRRVPWEKLG